MSYDSPPPPAEKKPRGCFFYGCLISIIAVVLGIAIIGGVAYWGWRYAINTVTEYTDTVAEEMPPIVMPEPERKTVMEKFQAYRKALEDGTATEPLVLTSEEVNVLINENEKLKGHMHIDLVGDEVKAKISMPVKEMFDVSEVAGRFFNGSAKLKIAFRDGDLSVKAEEIEVKGKPLPEAISQGFKGKNLAKDTDVKDEDLDKIESIVVKNSTLIITPRPAKKPGDATPDATKDAAPPAEAKPAEPLEAPKEPKDPGDAPKPEPAPGGDAPKGSGTD